MPVAHDVCVLWMIGCWLSVVWLQRLQPCHLCTPVWYNLATPVVGLYTLLDMVKRRVVECSNVTIE